MNEEIIYHFDQIFKSLQSKIPSQQFTLVVLIGNASVGKTSILHRFIHNELPPAYAPTVGVQFSKRIIPNPINGGKVQLHLWDTAGQQRYKALTTHHYRGAHGALVVFDITNRDSYNEVTRWIQQVKNNAEDDCSIYLIEIAQRQEKAIKLRYAGQIIQTPRITARRESQRIKLKMLEQYKLSVEDDADNQDAQSKQKDSCCS